MIIYEEMSYCFFRGFIIIFYPVNILCYIIFVLLIFCGVTVTIWGTPANIPYFAKLCLKLLNFRLLFWEKWKVERWSFEAKVLSDYRSIYNITFYSNLVPSLRYLFSFNI